MRSEGEALLRFWHWRPHPSGRALHFREASPLAPSLEYAEVARELSAPLGPSLAPRPRPSKTQRKPPTRARRIPSASAALCAPNTIGTELAAVDRSADKSKAGTASGASRPWIGKPPSGRRVEPCRGLPTHRLTGPLWGLVTPPRTACAPIKTLPPRAHTPARLDLERRCV
jgi:hypothetical protein